MSQLIGDVLSQRNYAEPPEVQQIKAFVLAEIGVTPGITITTDAYLVRLNSAAAAGALRGKVFQLQKQLGGTRRIVIRIS